MAKSVSFLVTGLEPRHDPLWLRATAAQHAAYFRVVRELVLIEYDGQLAAGLDRHGRPMRALAPSTLAHRRSAVGPADRHAPPLSPAHELSRTRSLLDARVVGTGIQVFWRFDAITRKRWGLVLDYHREGNARLPVRDVFGLSPEARRSVLAQGHAWWSAFARGLPVRAPRRRSGGRPARPVAATRPAYVPEPRNATLHGSQPGKVANLHLGDDVYSLSNGSARELFAAIKRGGFSGFRSYAD